MSEHPDNELPTPQPPTQPPGHGGEPPGQSGEHPHGEPPGQGDGEPGNPNRP